MKTVTQAPISVRRNGITLDEDHFKRRLLTTLASLNEGDFSVRLPGDLTGLDGKLADTFNQVATRMEHFGKNVSRLRNEVGRKGKIGERMPMGDAVGGWADRIEDVNSLVDDLSQPTVNMGRVIGAVA
jgi:methyl-accepting chemotaxis protein